MGFKLDYPLLGGGTANWVSLPYRYWPDGDVNNPDQRAAALCLDFATLALFRGSNPVSVPYHVQARTAEELCQDFNSRYAPHELGIVTKVDPEGHSISHPCNTLINEFNLTRGQGLFLTPVLSGGATQLDVQWTTY
jgi:hypothetical protein